MLFLMFQVFFPLAFREYNPDLVYVGKQKPAFPEVHITTGFWEHYSYQVGCFNNNDYKEARMRKKDFLDEDIEVNRTILSVFEESKLDVFRALDSELRTWYFTNTSCDSTVPDEHAQCLSHNSERLSNRAQLAKELFQFDARKVE